MLWWPLPEADAGGWWHPARARSLRARLTAAPAPPHTPPPPPPSRSGRARLLVRRQGPDVKGAVGRADAGAGRAGRLGQQRALQAWGCGGDVPWCVPDCLFQASIGLPSPSLDAARRLTFQTPNWWGSSLRARRRRAPTCVAQTSPTQTAMRPPSTAPTWRSGGCASGTPAVTGLLACARLRGCFWPPGGARAAAWAVLARRLTPLAGPCCALPPCHPLPPKQNAQFENAILSNASFGQWKGKVRAGAGRIVFITHRMR